MTTITIDRATVEQALEALEADCGGRCNAEYNPCWQREVAETLRAALAQQAEPVEPVAWLLQSELDDLMTCNHRRLSADSPTIWAPYDVSSPSPDMGLVPVYTAPPRQSDPQIEDRLARHGIPKP